MRNTQFWDNFAIENSNEILFADSYQLWQAWKEEEEGRTKRGFKCGGQVISNVTRHEVTCRVRLR
jgi:hypothetical protein